jgi:LuxR family transcriptional regulator, maltose regulon positive regulatory protein
LDRCKRNSSPRIKDTAIDSSSDLSVDPSRLVITPKLRAPTPRSEQVIRPRLLELLENTNGCKITLVSAPAGYGKTTLLAQWSHAVGGSLSFAWISLDEQDNDPVRLWMHIVEALHLAAPGEAFGADVLEGMSVTGRRLIETSLPMLINVLAELRLRLILVLDDYQFVAKDECHESVAFFAEHLPENVHLVLASRSDPPLPLGRLRARGEMNEIRDEQLAFSEEEAAYLLNETMGLDLTSDDLRLLLERTEGWPAAIYLASLSLQKREDKHAFIGAFKGSDRYIVDLLAEEVLAGVQEDVREFLLRTSILRRLAGPLCDVVVGREGSGKLLRELARSNLFLVPLDERGEWYRYHHLFSQFLLYELESSSPELVPILYGRASAWLESEGFFDAAIRHAVAATDFERAGLLVARHWYGYVQAGQMATVDGWLESLPEMQTARDPALLLVRAWICTLSGRGEEGERLLTLAESIPYEGPLPDGTASVEAGTATIRGIFGFGGVRSTLEAARRAVESEPEITSPRAALMRFGLGSSYYLSGETSAARKWLEEALELTVSGQPLLRTVCLSYLAIVATDEGRLEEAESLAREARTLTDRFGLWVIPQSSWVPIAFGNLLARRGDLLEAQAELESGLSVRRELPGLSPWPTLIGLLALARARSGHGDRGGARDALAEARTILERHPDSGIFPSLLALQERALRNRSRRRNGSLNGELTERELDVLRLLVGELSTRQMALSLYVAPSTVRTQVKSVYRKLGVSSRKEAVQEARARDLV